MKHLRVQSLIQYKYGRTKQAAVMDIWLKHRELVAKDLECEDVARQKLDDREKRESNINIALTFA